MQSHIFPRQSHHQVNCNHPRRHENRKANHIVPIVQSIQLLLSHINLLLESSTWFLVYGLFAIPDYLEFVDSCSVNLAKKYSSQDKRQCDTAKATKADQIIIVLSELNWVPYIAANTQAWKTKLVSSIVLRLNLVKYSSFPKLKSEYIPQQDHWLFS